MVSICQESDQSLSKKWARTRANGPTEAGQVRKRTREQARKRAELGQDVTQGQKSTETDKRGTEVQNIRDIKLMLRVSIKRC